jgi:hypothetical protein
VRALYSAAPGERANSHVLDLLVLLITLPTGWKETAMIDQAAMCDSRGVIRRVTRHALDDDCHSVYRSVRLVCRERRSRPELVVAIVHDDELAPVAIDEHAIFQRHAGIGARLTCR